MMVLAFLFLCSVETDQDTDDIDTDNGHWGIVVGADLMTVQKISIEWKTWFNIYIQWFEKQDNTKICYAGI